METNEIVEAIESFSSEKFVETIERSVNNFSFDVAGTVQALINMPDKKRCCLLQVIDSCIFALAHTDRIDGRNEVAAETCRKLNPPQDPMPDVGDRFLHMHPTLQQSAMKLLCCYLDKAEVTGYKTAIEDLKKERGSRWYCFPLI